MIKIKFYGKSITLINEDRSVTFVFCRTDQKKKSFQKAVKGIKLYQAVFLIIATSFNTSSKHSDFVCFSCCRNVFFDLSENWRTEIKICREQKRQDCDIVSY